MDLKDIKALIDLVKKNDLSDFELEEEGFKIRLRKNPPASQSANVGSASAPLPAAPMLPVASASPSGAASAPASAFGATQKEQGTGREIVSPMVGTFYRTPAPDAPPFVQDGSEITEETVVCIIEAMKVMNEIKAEVKGIIAEVLVESGKPVQFGQPMFRLK